MATWDNPIVAVTLRQVLALPVIQRANPLVVAAEGSLDNEVRWLHVSEQEDVASYLSGGELLLTTGMRLGTDARSQKQFVMSLAEAGVAGLAVRLGGSLGKQVPAPMAEEADRLGLPLIALRTRIAFVEAMEEIHRALVARQSETLRRAAEMRSQFTDLLLQGSSVQEITHRLAQLLDAAVVVADAAHRPVHAVGTGQVLEDGAWRRHSRSGHRTVDGPLQVHVEAGEELCAWVPLVLRDEPWGRLHVLRRGVAFDELDRMAVERAAAAIVLALMADRRSSVLRHHAGAALLTELVEGRLTRTAQFRRRAKSLGVDLGPGSTVLALAVSASGQTAVGGGPDDEERRAVDREVRAALSEAGAPLTGWYQDRLLVVLALPADTSPHGLAERLVAVLAPRYGVGVSERLPGGAARQAVLQSLESSRALSPDAADPRVRHFHELGLESLLVPSTGEPELARFVEGELGSLLSHDAVATEPLLPVLRALLEANGRVGRAAEALGIDRRTLATRIPALAQLLDADLGSFDARLRLGVAVRAMDVLGQGSAATPRSN
jgi:purine catabolism regulator